MPELSANPRFACLPEDKKKRITAAEEIAFLAALPLKFRPGDKFSYHISGYQFLGFIVEKASGKSYADFLKQRVFDPSIVVLCNLNGGRADEIQYGIADLYLAGVARASRP